MQLLQFIVVLLLVEVDAAECDATGVKGWGRVGDVLEARLGRINIYLLRSARARELVSFEVWAVFVLSALGLT